MKMRELLKVVFLIIIWTNIIDIAAANSDELECDLINIKRFSSEHRTKYYECNGISKYAILKECPKRHFYWPQREKCFPETEKTLNTTKHGYAFGNAFFGGGKPDEPKRMTQKVLRFGTRLGDLYDAQNDQFLSGTSLWSAQELKKVKKDNRMVHQSTNLKYNTGKTTLDRLSLMDINAELKLSFLGGLIEVSGSASFVRHSSILQNDETFTLVYQSTAYSDIIPISLPLQYPKICDRKATHIVSKIVYGQNAYFFFKHTKRDSSEKQDIAGSLQASVKLIPGFSIQGSASVKLTGEEKKIMEKTEVRFNGDFRLKNGFPTTYEGAINAFKELSDSVAVGPDYNGAVPVEIELTPKKEFCSGAVNSILVSIADSAMGKVSDMLMGLQELQTYILTLLQTRQSKIYPAVQSNLNLYKTKLEEKEINIKSDLQKLLPAIKGRTDGKSEKDLMTLLITYNKSPFNTIKSTIFLDSRGLEIKALNLLMKDLDSSVQNNFKIADYKEPNKAALLLNYKKIVQFSVNILQSENVTKEFLGGANSPQTTFWYNDDNKASALGYQKYLFKNFIAANKDSTEVGFLIDINLRNETQPFQMTAKEKGYKIGDFIVPNKPKKPSLLDCTDQQFTTTIKNPNNKWITKVIIQYWRLVDGAKGSMKKEFVFSGFGETNATINGLTPLTTYEFQVVHFTKFGVSPSSEVSQLTTSPCSEPKNLKLNTVTRNSLSIAWSVPVCGKNIRVNRYKVALKDSSDKVTNIKVTSATTSGIIKNEFTNLHPSMAYKIYVEAVVITNVIDKTTNASKQVLHKGIPAILSCHTSPRAPHSLRLVKVGYSNITFTWSAPQTGHGEKVLEYLVKYQILNVNGSAAADGTQITKSSLTKTNAEITGLTMGILYGLSVKVITNNGESKYSSTIFAKTLYTRSKIDQLRETLQKLFRQKVTAIRKSFEMRQNNTDAKMQSTNAKVMAFRKSFEVQLNNVDTKIQANVADILHIKQRINHGRKTYFISTYKLSWNDARNSCIKKGGQLVFIESAEENKSIWSELKAKSIPYAWIGLNDRRVEGKFEWEGQSPKYTNWLAGQPNNYDRAEDCVLMLETDGTWTDQRCILKTNYICQFHK